MRIGGRYRLGERIGQGGMGRVRRARDEMLERPVAAKELWLDSPDAGEGPPPHGRGHLTVAVLAGHHSDAALSLRRAGRHAPCSVRRGRPTSAPAP